MQRWILIVSRLDRQGGREHAGAREARGLSDWEGRQTQLKATGRQVVDTGLW